MVEPTNLQQQSVTITSVTVDRQQKQRYVIYVDTQPEQPFMVVHEDSLIKFNLFKGRTIEVDELQSIIEQDEVQRSYASAIRYLGIRPRTKQQLLTYLLNKGYSEQANKQVIERLQRERYIDDEDYARKFAQERLHNQKKGRLLVQQELYKRGIDQEEAKNATSQLNEEDELQVASELAVKKWPRTKGEFRSRKQKVMAFLLRRGFSHSIVRQAMANLNPSEDKDPDFDELDN